MRLSSKLAVGQNQWYHFGVGAPPLLVYFSGDWDVHCGYDLDFDPWPIGSLPLNPGLGTERWTAARTFGTWTGLSRWWASASMGASA